MAGRVFVAQSRAAALARIPLLAADNPKDVPAGPLLEEGMFLASRQADAAATRNGRGADGERLATTRRGYEIRARSRPTPHGVFAGVARARFAGQAANLRLGSGHRARSNPGAGWLAAVCDQVVADPAVLPLLTLTANNLVIRRGPRLEHERQATPGETGTQRVTVRATDATLLIMSVCARGATASQVFAAVARRWPVPEPAVRTTVTELVRGGFLLTDLLPGNISDDPIRHLLGRLPALHPLRGILSRLRQLLANADRHRPGEPARLTALAAARRLADQICFHERPLSVDVALDAHLVLPAALADEAAAAAGVLWRTGSDRDPLAGYHERFLERYGPHRLVPLLDITDTATGLGTGIPGAADLPGRRVAVLASLLGRAAAQGQTEIVVDTATITELAAGQRDQPPPRTAEIYVRVIADSPQDLAAGRLRSAVCPGGSQDAGSTLGRFTHMLPAAAGQGESLPTALIAELVVRPRTAEAAALAPPSGFASWRIPVGIPARKGDLDLDDLHLMSNGEHLLLWSARHDQQVIPVLFSRLAPGLLPPLARFLQLVGHAGCRPWHGWSWGPLANTPFQPRVRYRRTVLAPARWVLPPPLTQAAHDRAGWNDELNAWRATTVPSPPDVVVTDDGDRRLPLDLRRPDDRELLRRYVCRGLPAVSEQPGGPGALQAVVPGPAGHHVLELAVPLARNTPVPGLVCPVTMPARPVGEGLYLPGGPWLSLAVRAPAHCHDELLAGLASIAAELAGHFDTWFWLRYANAAHGPHLRARFHGDPAALGGTVLPAISAWCTELIKQRLSAGFTVEPYDQEAERYGGPHAIGAAEQVFGADSHLVLGILAACDLDQRLVAAAVSAAAIARTVADGDPAAVQGRRLDRAARQRATALRPQVRATRWQDPASSPLRCVPDPAWSARHDALAAYRATLKPAQRPACAAALIHMHANRLLGRAGAERIAGALAADLLAFRPWP